MFEICLTATRRIRIRTRAACKFVYASLLAISCLSTVPTPASAQEMARGKFTLGHEVHWQGALVPAGDYRFTLGSDGVLALTKLNGPHVGFLVMVHDTDEAKPSDVSRLILKSGPEGRTYVSAMLLPDFGMTLNFTLPGSGSQIAKAGTSAAASGQ